MTKEILEKAMNFSEEHNPYSNPDFVAILSKLKSYHKELLKGNDKLADNPVLAGEYQGKLRLEVSRLFKYMNEYIDLQVETGGLYARERQLEYKAGIELGKSPSAAEKHASEVTRVIAANEAIAKLRIQQIKNEYDRYNSIAIYLATRMKEFQSERMMG